MNRFIRNFQVVLSKLFFAIAFFYSTSTLAAYSYIEVLDRKDGLPSGVISSSYQDDKGVIWFGTKEGLVKYDGSRFTEIQNSNYYIFAITPDDQGNLFLSTRLNGVVFFDTTTETFKKIRKGPRSIYAGTSDLQEGHWFGGYHHLMNIDKNHQFKFFEFSGNLTENLVVDSLAVTTSGLFLSAKSNKTDGLYHLKDNQLELVREIGRSDLTSSQDKSRLWILSQNELLEYQHEPLLWRHPLSAYSVFLMGPIIKATISFVTNDGFLVKYDLENGVETQRIILEPNVLDILNSKKKLRLILFDDSVTWFYADQNLLKLQHRDFYSYLTTPLLKDARVTSIVEGDDNLLWVGTFNSGLFSYSYHDGWKRYIPPEKEFDVGGITHIYRLDNSELLIAGWTNSVVYIPNRDLWKPSRITVENKLIAFRENGNTLRFGEGIFERDHVTDIESKVDIKLNNDWPFESDPQNLAYFSFIPYQADIFVLAGQAGAGLYNAKSQNYQPLTTENKDFGDISNVFRNRVIQDKFGHIWASSNYNGVEQFKMKDGQQVGYQFFGTKEGITSKRNISLLPDNAGNIWLTTSTGVYRLDHQSNGITYFDENDGFLLDTFISGHSLSSTNGKLYFGANNGIVVIDPEKYKESEIDPLLVVSQLFINEEKTPVNNQYNLSSSSNNLKVDLATIDYRGPSKIQYAHRLLGYNNWQFVGNNNVARYQNISPGKYTFQAKSTDSFGRWQQNTIEFDINVAFPVWQRWWAFLIYFLLLFTLLYCVVRIRTSRLVRYTNQLEEKVKERTTYVNYLLDKKNDLFVRVAHELRTPLTLVKGPITQMLSSLENEVTKTDLYSDSYKNKLSTANRNTDRLIKMVEQLMTLAKANVDCEQSKTYYDLGETIIFVCQSLKTLADKKGITLEHKIHTALNSELLEDSLETILFNLCVNAIKYAYDNTTIEVSLKQKNKMAVVEIIDQGPGIPREFYAIMFDQFTQVNHASNGVGLGLSIVKEFVEVNGGKISIDLNYQLGAKFIVELPLSVSSMVTNRKLELPEYLLDTQLEEFSNQVAKLNLNVDSLIDSSVEKNQSKMDILIIEDTVELCQYLSDLLKNDYHCHLAFDGQQGLEMAKAICPDLIISDVMMPELDGFSVLSALRNDINTSHIPIILLTALDENEARVNAYLLKADDFLTKPFKDSVLLARVQSLLDIRSLTVLNVLRNYSNLKLENQKTESKIESKEEQFLCRIRTVVEENFHDINFKVSNMADSVNMTERTLQRKLSILTGMSPNIYLRVYRLDKAMEMLSTEQASVKSVALSVGFNSKYHFNNLFKGYVGVTPGEYQRRFTTSDK